MNLSVPFGLLMGAAVMAWAALTGIKNSSVFLSPHAAAVVIGGTIAAALICVPFSTFVSLFKIYIRLISGRSRDDTMETINEVVRLSIAVNDGKPLESELGSIKNPFLKESLELLEKGGLSNHELEDVLEKRIEFQNERYKRDGVAIKTIGKFPPAFGLVGTTMGMISLLQGLGEADAFDRLGPSMSIALVATFYGLIMANVLLIPFGENLGAASEEDLIRRRMIVEGVLLLREKKHPLLVEEYLKSYISPKDRVKMKKVAVG
jgi:chemotaxis protein MotA